MSTHYDIDHFNSPQMDNLKKRKLNGLFNENWISLLKCAQFGSKGKCITGYVTTHKELEQVFESFKKYSGTEYSTRIPCSTETSDVIAHEKFLNSSTKPRLFWKMKVGEPNISYDKIPFMMYGQMAEFLCIYGPKTRKYTGEVKRENMIISLPEAIEFENASDCKVACPAHITIRRILRFPDHKLADRLLRGGVSAVRKVKKEVLDKLTEAIYRGTARAEDRYYISLPTPLAHSSHDYLNSYMTFGSNIILHSTLNVPICKLLGRGTTGIDEIQTELEQFIQSSSSPHEELGRECRSFYPHKNDIAKHIYTLYESGKVFSNKINGQLDDTKGGSISPIPATFSASESTLESVLGVIVNESVTNDEIQTNLVTNDFEEHFSQEPQSLSESSPTLEVFADTTTKTKFLPLQSFDHKSLPTVKMELPKGASNTLEKMQEATLVSEEVRNLLKLIEFQTYICKDVASLNSLSKQLTNVATNFSCKMTGIEQLPNQNQKQSFPPASHHASTPKQLQ